MIVEYYVARYLIHRLCINLNKITIQWGKKVCTKTELLNFKITLPLDKLDVVISRLVSNDLTFIPVDIHLVTFLLLY